MDGIVIEGTVLERLEEGLFRAELPNGHRVFAHFSRKMKMGAIPILPGNKVLLEISPYDMSRGRIAGLAEDRETGATGSAEVAEKVTRTEEAEEFVGPIVGKVVEEVALGKGVSFS